MIQLQYSSDTGSAQNKVFWTDNYISGSTLILSLTSSFSGDYSEVGGNIISNKTSDGIGGWVQFQISSSNAPTASGFYEGNIYKGCVDEAVKWINANVTWSLADEHWNDWAIGCLIPVLWNEATQKWNNVSDTWNNYLESNAGTSDLLTTERVFVSGSDYDVIFDYEYQDLAYYTVYNG